MHEPTDMLATDRRRSPCIPPRAAEGFAVIDGPDGTDVLEAPYFRDEALDVKLRHANRFWCTTQAGGCGKEMELAAGRVVKPYFPHEVVGSAGRRGRRGRRRR